MISCTELFIQRTSSVSTEQLQNGVKRSQEQNLEREVILDTKVLEESREKFKREELKSLVDIPKLPPSFGNRMLENLESFESMPRRSQIEFLRTTAGFYHPQGRRMGKVHIVVEISHKTLKRKGVDAVCFD